jgi:hypothetical protein
MQWFVVRGGSGSAHRCQHRWLLVVHHQDMTHLGLVNDPELSQWSILARGSRKSNLRQFW